MATLTITIKLTGELPFDLERDVLEALASNSYLSRQITTMTVSAS